MKTHTYKGYTVRSLSRGVWIVWLRGVRIPWPHYFRTFKKAQAWIDTHPPGWPRYEKVRYYTLAGNEYSVLLRDIEIVGDQWLFRKTVKLKGPMLKGWRVNQDGSTADLLSFCTGMSTIIERTPLRLDPYSKQLQELVEVSIE